MVFLSFPRPNLMNFINAVKLTRTTAAGSNLNHTDVKFKFKEGFESEIQILSRERLATINKKQIRAIRAKFCTIPHNSVKFRAIPRNGISIGNPNKICFCYISLSNLH